MCKLMTVHPSGYYAWKCDPVSSRGKDDQRLLGLLKHAWLESGGVYHYNYPKAMNNAGHPPTARSRQENAKPSIKLVRVHLYSPKWLKGGSVNAVACAQLSCRIRPTRDKCEHFRV